ncbi:unnamed protein product (macronuclear) [Paramecium tetraurelia]|uniref:RING-type domain-containing protein n=1 Tax=Paramecium tetraurelia TaxID=5888 RepID=A0BQY5_PARTE|nr:uncharacterized protein GSPATT00031181001 [Paramecium tetraurelia]CAK60952.1 unnamed protein product [Paramecium tetraurelia]|eukprot:XP_001428350.1 hypothetical protein (macronuclear) [Paramecium tetraurelia strain d4-2]
MILIAASMHIREHRSFSLRTPSIHIRDEDPKDVVKSSICGIMMGVLFMIIFAIIGMVGIFTNIDEEIEYIWMLVVLTFTYVLFIPYFILILQDLRRISSELEKHQDESIVMNPYAFASSMNTISAITNTEKYNLFRLLNVQFFIISLIISAFLINSEIVIGSLLAIVNYIVAATIIIYVCRRCWLGCCNIKIATKNPKRYHFYRYPSPNQVKDSAFAFAVALVTYYVCKLILYVIFLCLDQEDFQYTYLTSLFYAFIMIVQFAYVSYLIKRTLITQQSKKYFKCYMTLFQSLYLSQTTQNCVLKGLYFFSLLCTYIAFFLEKPYLTIKNSDLFGVQQFCSYEHFIYLFTLLQLIYFLLFRSYCVNKEEEQIQIFDFNQVQTQDNRLQWIQNQQDYPIYDNQEADFLYFIHDLEALQEIYDNLIFQSSQLELKMRPRNGQLINLTQWIEDKKFQLQVQGRGFDDEYFANLKSFIKQNIRSKRDAKDKQKQSIDRIECAICLQQLDTKQNITRLGCHSTHKFHTECIERWINAVHKCPLCNQPA